MILKPYLLLVLLTIFTVTVKAQTYSEQYEKCSEDLKKLTEVDSVYFELLKKRNDCLVGAMAPNFTATTVDNEVIEPSKLIGKVVVLNFWFTKCEPCIKEMPYLNKLVTTFSGKDVAFISLAPEDPEKLKAFFTKHPFAFKTIPNSETIRRDVFKLFSIWPYTIIIDKNGKINTMSFGTLDDTTFAEYQNRIQTLVNQ